MLTQLGQIVRTYAGPELDFDAQLILRRDEVPPCQLAPTGVGARLGWNTWACSRVRAATPTRRCSSPTVDRADSSRSREPRRAVATSGRGATCVSSIGRSTIGWLLLPTLAERLSRFPRGSARSWFR